MNDASIKGESETKSIYDVLDGAEETTNHAGIARNFEKNIQTQYGPGKVGYLEDGTTVVARAGSKTGGTT